MALHSLDSPAALEQPKPAHVRPVSMRPEGILARGCGDRGHPASSRWMDLPEVLRLFAKPGIEAGAGGLALGRRRVAQRPVHAAVQPLQALRPLHRVEHGLGVHDQRKRPDQGGLLRHGNLGGGGVHEVLVGSCGSLAESGPDWSACTRWTDGLVSERPTHHAPAVKDCREIFTIGRYQDVADARLSISSARRSPVALGVSMNKQRLPVRLQWSFTRQ